MPELIPPLKPRRTYGFMSIAVVAVVAVVALVAAWGALVAVERTSRAAVERALFLAGEDWAKVEVNGLRVILSGDAPSEAARFVALSAAAHEVDGARVIDQMVLPDAVAIVPPQFSIEMLRNEAGISLIGLIPAETDREALSRRMRAIDPVQPVTDFLETADHPVPNDWDNVLDFTLDVAGMLPRSKISMTADNVTVEAIAASPDEKRAWEQEIRRERPAGLRLALDIRAPLDVVSPYIVRFLSDDQGARFDACTAYTPADRNRIVSAGIAAGVKGAVDCTIGLGVPSPDWPDAVARGIKAVRDMGGGSLTFSDADITLIAPENTPQDTYDRVIGELEADLPEVFSLHAVLTEPETGPVSPTGPPEFVATLGDGGAVQLRGRVASEQDRTIVETLARARFGTRKVYAPLRLDPALPASWAVRTLAGLEALDHLADGRVVVQPDLVVIAGTTGDKGASAQISRLFSEKLGEAEDFRVNVKYEESLDPIAALPTPEECAVDVNAALAQNKITFAPGSAEIERASAATVDRIAEILKTCPDVAMEIGGYTDSQGREEMNRALSQRRAEAVVSALLARRVLTTNLKAFGYGEDFPIADNDTEEGREANRRIEFSLIGETRPRAGLASDSGDDPTIRPPARPADLGASTDDETDAGQTGQEGADDTESASGEGTTEDGAVEETAPQETALEETGAEDSTAPTPDAGTETAPEEGGSVDAATDEPAAPQADPQVDGLEADTGTGPETETPGTDGLAAPEGSAAAAEADLEGGTVADGGDDPAAMTESPDTAAEADNVTAQTGEEPETDASVQAVDQAAPEEPSAQDGSGPPQEDGDTPSESAAALTPPEVGPATGDAMSPVASQTDTSSSVEASDTAAEAGIPEVAEGETEITVEEAAGATVETDLPADPEMLAASGEAIQSEAPEIPDAARTGDDDEASDPVSEDLAATGEIEAPAQDAPSAATEAAEAENTGTPRAETSDAGVAGAQTPGAEAADTDTAGTETAIENRDAAATATAATTPSDIPSTRPRARPPIVVHPDLEGVRPRPRPDDVPDAPTTE